MSDFFSSITGGYTLGQFLALIFFFLIGLMLYSLQETSERNIESKNTPRKFSWSFLLNDNVKRFMLTFILIYLQFRFFKELTGQELNEYTALLIGYAGNGLSGFGKRRIKALQADRNKLLKS